MSLLGPTCVASDGTTLYAFLNTGNGDTAAITLAVSNTAPTSLTNLSWKVISTVPQKDLNYIGGFAMVGQIDCIVNDKGVFTIMSLGTKTANNDNPLLTKAAGLQYNPATKSWTNINSSDDYKWTLGTGSALFEVANGATSTVMQIYGTGVATTTSSVAVYDPSTQTMVQRPTPWAANGTPVQYAASSTNVYTLAYNIGLTSNTTLTIGAITSDGAPPASPKQVDLALGDTCMVYSSISLKSVVRDNLYYLFCGDQKQTTFSWFTYDGTKLSAPTVAKVAVQQSAGFLPLGPAGSPATWAFMYDMMSVYGVTLTGAQAGAWQTLPYKFNVTGAPGSGGSGSGGVGGGNVGRDDGSTPGSGGVGGLSTGALAGIIAGSVVVLVAILCTIWRRKKSSAKTAQVAQQPPQQPFHPEQPPSQQGDDHHTKPTILPATTVQAHQQQHYPTKYYQSPHSEAPASVKTTYLSPHSEVLASVTTNHQSPHTVYIPPTTSAPHTIPSTPGNPSTIWSPQSFTNTLTDSEMDSSTIAASSPAYYNGSIPYGNPQQYAQEHTYALDIDPRAPQLYPTLAAPQDYGQHGQPAYPPPPGYLRAPQERNEYAQ
ncbi:hypothetical protein BGZ93_009989 [Podila epicladia]|nr:hypothetical protein BGZ92_009678 [Podila epicladia]KAG0089190.1 hypothetical protein BGZ93_009989 [Podila epicladia]